MNPEQLAVILKSHKEWLEAGKGEKANLSCANLSGANLSGANLSCANLSGANLSGANLSGANLSGAKLIGANLRHANLSCANLSGANLRHANLSGAHLRHANLSGANLWHANLSGANLWGAKLIGANLSCAVIDEPVCRMDFGGWSICIRAEETSIGCQTHKNSAWLKATPESVCYMDDKAADWWTVHGAAVKAAIRCVMKKAKAKRSKP